MDYSGVYEIYKAKNRSLSKIFEIKEQGWPRYIQKTQEQDK